MKRDEHHLQRLFIQWLDLQLTARPELALGYGIPNQRGLDPLGAVLRYREGLRSGVADWCLPLAHGDFHGLYIEFKDPGGQPSTTQAPWLQAAHHARYRTCVAEDLDFACDVLNDYLRLPAKYDLEPVRIFCRELIAARAERRAKGQAARARKKGKPPKANLPLSDLFPR